MSDLMMALIKSLIANGVKVPAEEPVYLGGEKIACGNELDTIFNLDFSEHDKIFEDKIEKLKKENAKVYQENMHLEEKCVKTEDEICKLKRKIEDLEAIIAEGKKPYISVSENGVSVGCECGGYHLAKERITELEKENSELEKEIQNMRGARILLRQRCKGEAVEFFDRNMFGSLIISSPPLEDSKRISELEDRHQSDCIRINQLITTIDVLTERYQKLREVHGV